MLRTTIYWKSYARLNTVKKKTTHLLGLIVGILAIFIFALFLADFVSQNGAAQDIVGKFGYIGIALIALVSGFNLIFPIPVVFFVPVFTAAGYPLWGIIVAMAVGITIADSIGYLIGSLGHTYTKNNYPTVFRTLEGLKEKHRKLILPLVFVYAAIAPLPNELIMIPLAVLGFRYRVLIVPFILGTLVYVTLVAYGAQNIFELLF